MNAYLALRPRQRRFVDAYIELGSKAGAMRAIGYKGKWADRLGWILWQRPEIQAAYQERTAEAIEAAGLNLARLMSGVGHRANADRAKFFAADGSLLPVKDWPPEVRDTVESLEFDDKGKLLKIRTASRNEAAKLGMQYLKIAEQHEHTGKGGTPLPATTVQVIFVDKAEKEALSKKLDEEI